MAGVLIPAVASMAAAVAPAVKSAKRKPRSSRRKVQLTVSRSTGRKLDRRAANTSRKTFSKGKIRKSKLSSITSQRAPVAVGMISANNSFMIAGQADSNADFDRRGSLKIRGSSLMNVTAQAAASTLSVLFDNASSTYSRAWAISLKRLSGRAQLFEEMYGYYCYRHLKVRYIPQVSVQSSASSNSIVFGITADAGAIVDIGTGSLTCNNILDCPQSVFSPVWDPCEMEYDHRGSFVATTSAGSSADGPQVHLYLLGVLNGISPAGVTTNYGSFWVDWEVDFYQPAMVDTSAIDRPLIDTKELKSSCSNKDEKSLFRSVENDDVKSLFEETVDSKPTLKRTESIPPPRPPVSGVGTGKIRKD